MGRRGGWLSIPPELLVPTLFVGLLRPVVAWLDASPGGLHLEHNDGTAQSVLALFGLLELRPRSTGAAARWLNVAAVVAAVPVLELLLLEFTPLLGISRKGLIAIFPTIDTWQALAMAVVLSSAARTWRSPLGVLLVIAAVLSHPPMIVLRMMFEVLEAMSASPIAVLVRLGEAVLVLATYARLGAAPAPTPDIPRAERGARRAARWQRLRVTAVALGGASLALHLLPWNAAYLVAIVAWLLMVLTAGGTISGLLGLARGDVPGLSARALCIAAFATLVSTLTAESDAFLQYLWWTSVRETDAWQVASVLATQTGIAVGIVAIASYLRTLDDRPLARAVERWFACLVLLGVATVVATAVGPGGSVPRMVGATALALSSQAISLLILAHVHARLARRLAVVSAVDAF